MQFNVINWFSGSFEKRLVEILKIIILAPRTQLNLLYYYLEVVEHVEVLTAEVPLPNPL